MPVGAGQVSDLSAEDLAPVAPNNAIEAVSTAAIDENIPAFVEDAEAVLSGGPEEDGEQAADQPADAGEQPAVEAAEEEQAEGEQPEAELSEVEQKKLSQKAQKRFQNLANQNNQLRDEMQRVQAAYSRQIAQMQAEYQRAAQAQQEALAEQNRLLREELFARRQRTEAEEFEKLPLQEQIKRSAKRDALSETEKLIEQRLAPLQQALEEERALRAQAENQFKRTQRLQKLGQEVDEGTAQLMAGLDQAAFTPADRSVLSEMFMGYAGGKGVMPKQAVPEFQKVLDKYVAARLKAQGQKNKQQLQVSKQIPPATAPGAKTAAAAGKVTQKRQPPAEMKHRDPESLFEFFAKQSMEQQ